MAFNGFLPLEEGSTRMVLLSIRLEPDGFYIDKSCDLFFQRMMVTIKQFQQGNVIFALLYAADTRNQDRFRCFVVCFRLVFQLLRSGKLRVKGEHQIKLGKAAQSKFDNRIIYDATVLRLSLFVYQRYNMEQQTGS